MSTGLSTPFWVGPVPFANGMNDAGNPSNCLMFLADRDYDITNIWLRNMHSTATIRVILALTTAGGSLTGQAALSRRIHPDTAMGPGEWFQWSGRIPFTSTWGLLGLAEFLLGEQFIFAAITGEARD